MLVNATVKKLTELGLGTMADALGDQLLDPRALRRAVLRGPPGTARRQRGRRPGLAPPQDAAPGGQAPLSGLGRRPRPSSPERARQGGS